MRVIIRKTNTYCKVMPITEESDSPNAACNILKFLHCALRVKVSNSYYRKRYSFLYQHGQNDYHYFFNMKSATFLSGFFPVVKKLLESNQIKTVVEDQCFRPVANIIVIPNQLTSKFSGKTISLRDYQLEALRLIYEQGRHRGVFAQATNAGKTVLAVAISMMINVKTLFIVDRIELHEQALHAFKEYSLQSCGYIRQNEFVPGDVTIAMQKTLYNLIETHGLNSQYGQVLLGAQMIFADECHKAGSQTWRYLLSRAKNAYFRFGLSGTPHTSDPVRNAYIFGLLGPVIQKVKNRDLIERGISAVPTIKMIKYDSEYVPSNLVYATAYKKAITECYKRNELIVRLVKERSVGTTLIIVKHIDHGNILVSMLDNEYKFVSGKTHKTERLDIYKKLKFGHADVVIASLIYKEGIDIDTIDTLIYAVGEKAPITILQVIGRGLRKRTDKNKLLFYDFYDVHNSYTRVHTINRLRLYKKECFNVEFISL